MVRYKKAKEIFGQVDPNLRVVSAGRHKKTVKREETEMVSVNDWENAKGRMCSKCGRECFRVIDSLCSLCNNKKVAKDDRKMEIASLVKDIRFQLRKGAK